MSTLQAVTAWIPKASEKTSMLKEDLAHTYRLAEGSRLSRVVYMCLLPGVRAVVVYRFARWLLTKPLYLRLPLKPLKLILHRRMMSKWGIDIDPGASIGKGLRIAHYGGIFIGDRVVIGEYFYVSHDVTIGRSRSDLRQGLPMIGNNVYVAPGAKIVGNIKIGNNARIGTNAVVDRDVPDNALVQMRAPQVVVFSSYAKDSTSGSPGNEAAV
jgi:serine O-acetyltransferase